MNTLTNQIKKDQEKATQAEETMNNIDAVQGLLRTFLDT